MLLLGGESGVFFVIHGCCRALVCLEMSGKLIPRKFGLHSQTSYAIKIQHLVHHVCEPTCHDCWQLALTVGVAVRWSGFIVRPLFREE